MQSIVHFGGPDQAPRALRDELERRVDCVPAGGAIQWMTYYFRDERLAGALSRARRRGVSVTICLEGSPRHKGANDRVISKLRGESGIAEGLKVVRHWLPGNLHLKIYCFSHPKPVALVGSFNPSGNEPDDPTIVGDIGDQDRGHNLLVELTDPALVAACIVKASCLQSGVNRYGSLATPVVSLADPDEFQLFFFPGFGTNPLDGAMSKLGRGSTFRIAASHVSDPYYLRLMSALVQRGVEVTLITHHTQRRSPESAMKYLRGNGVRVYRYEHPDEMPMHDKYILAKGPAGPWCMFGSFNLKRRSRWLNDELLVQSTNTALWDRLDERWRQTIAEPWCTG